MNADYQQALKDCRRAMMNMLARREHSAQELRQKSKEKFHAQPHRFAALQSFDHHGISDIIDDAILKLQEDGLQNDERFTDCYIRARAALLYGPERIKAELFKKGVSQTVISTQMQTSEIDWQWSLQLALDKKCQGSPAALEINEQRKLMAYLARRGFDEHDVRNICKQDYLD